MAFSGSFFDRSGVSVCSCGAVGLVSSESSEKSDVWSPSSSLSLRLGVEWSRARPGDS